MSQDVAIFFLAHQWSESIAFRFARLRHQASPHADCFLLLQDDEGPVVRHWREFLEANGIHDVLRTFVAAALPGQLGFPFFAARQILGNSHFPLLVQARQGSWRHCWQVESDVEYRGDWQAFFRQFDGNESDLLVSHLHRHADWPTWAWWNSLVAPTAEHIAPDRLCKGFFPTFRISRQGLDAVEAAHREGWSGHYEAVVPTVIRARGLAVHDLRATTPCYEGGSQNPSAILPLQSTMRWRPEITPAEFLRRGTAPLLFHPVKQNWAFDNVTLRSWPEPTATAPSSPTEMPRSP